MTEHQSTLPRLAQSHPQAGCASASGPAFAEGFRFGVRLLVSGGQTGVDRGALDAAITIGLPHGGWCPRDRKAEDGPIPRQYQLLEMTSEDYSHRTRQNVLDSQATLILSQGHLSGGTALTRRLAEELNRPLLVIKQEAAQEAQLVLQIQQWLAELQPPVLNVAGPRESQRPGIGDWANRIIQAVFTSARR